ncbi:MAG: hypothetical protein O3A46_04735 [Candidatus Poribacteria bacterium]|nr:hypothetical protein [Candidatus Poribacteria bacterium]
MSTTTRHEAHELLDALPDSELGSVTDYLAGRLNDHRQRQLDAAHRRMAEIGLRVREPHPLSADDQRRLLEWKPVKTTGEPVSETIIRERR